MWQKSFTLCAFALLLLGCNTSESPVQNTLQNPVATAYTKRIVAFGDSLTEGYGVEKNESYPAQLQMKLAQEGFTQYEVINAGVSGETTSGALSRLDFIRTLKPDIVLLETGGNDGLRGIDVKVTQANLEKIVAGLQAANITVILAGMEMAENLGVEYVRAFEGMYPEVAKKYDLPFIPRFLSGVAADPDLNIGDGIHPNAQGYAIIVSQNIWPVLKTYIK